MTASFKPARYAQFSTSPLVAVRVGFEPTCPVGLTPFQGGQFDHAPAPYQINSVMRLYEVTSFQEKTLEQRDWKNPREVMKWLESKGFQKKGSGSFAVAYVHPNYKRIVKISKRQDICWLRFAYWTLRMTSNPNVPYIDWVRVYGENDKFFIAVVEKLAPFNKKAIWETKDLPGLAYLYLYEEWFQGDETIEDRLKRDGVIKKKNKYEFTAPSKWSGQIQRYLENVKGGKRFIRTLESAERFATAPCDYDMHDGNLMYRPSDRSLVIIDPLADLSQIGGGFII